MIEKTRFFTTVRKHLLDEFLAIAERMRLPVGTAQEIAMEQFIKQYKDMEIPGITTPPTTEMEKAQCQ